MGEVIAVCNQKGGVGKTTTAINLATSLAVSGRRLLLVDVDPQGNATGGIGIDKKTIDKSVYQAIVQGVSLEGVILNTQVNNLYIVPSNISLTGAEIELIDLERREFRLQEALIEQKGGFDFIFIDTPPSLGLLTINALAAADTVLIPLQCEYYALEGLSSLINTINLVKKNLNPNLEIKGILLTMADYRTNLTDEVIQEAQRFFKNKVFKTIIPRSVRLSEAPGFGKPILFYDKTSIGAQKYSELAQELMEVKCKQEEPLAGV